ncbi:MAG: hypothetical protein H6Q14_2569 [Bacteroidetes bacterium]|jgi:hypothetical protein|nr:hypothetical protein [Bacteroidota bacterium]
MKKLFFAAIAAVMSVSAFAVSNQNMPSTQNGVCSMQAQEGDFKEVPIDSLNEKVKLVVAELGQSQSLLKLEYSVSKKQTRVTVANKETKEAKIIILDEEGKPVV